MNSFPHVPTADPLALPGPEPILHGFLLIGFFLHALFMNLVLGGTPIMVVTDWLGHGTGRERYRRLGTALANMLPSFLVVAVVLGVASLLFVQAAYGPVLYPAMLLVGNMWIAVLGAVILGYYGLYAYKYWRVWLGGRPGLQLALGSVNVVLFCGVAWIFVMVGILMLNPEHWQDIHVSGLRGMLSLPSLFPRYGHMILAAVAGMGIFLMCYGLYLGSGSRRPDSPGDEPTEDDATWVTKYGVAWALAGTLPQIVVGPWLMLSLPDGVRAELISGQSLGSLAFFVGLTVGLLSLVFLNAALMIPHVRGMALAGIVSVLVTVCLMVVVRDAVRQSWLAKHSVATQLSPDWGAMAMGGVVFVMGLGLIGYVVHAYRNAHPSRRRS